MLVYVGVPLLTSVDFYITTLTQRVLRPWWQPTWLCSAWSAVGRSRPWWRGSTSLWCPLGRQRASTLACLLQTDGARFCSFVCVGVCIECRGTSSILITSIILVLLVLAYLLRTSSILITGIILVLPALHGTSITPLVPCPPNVQVQNAGRCGQWLRPLRGCVCPMAGHLPRHFHRHTALWQRCKPRRPKQRPYRPQRYAQGNHGREFRFWVHKPC